MFLWKKISLKVYHNRESQRFNNRLIHTGEITQFLLNPTLYYCQVKHFINMKLLLRVSINNWGKLHHRLDLSSHEIQNSGLILKSKMCYLMKMHSYSTQHYEICLSVMKGRITEAAFSWLWYRDVSNPTLYWLDFQRQMGFLQPLVCRRNINIQVPLSQYFLKTWNFFQNGYQMCAQTTAVWMPDKSPTKKSLNPVCSYLVFVEIQILLVSLVLVKHQEDEKSGRLRHLTS